MHASLAKHYMNGGSVPNGGSSKILETIGKVIKKNGGTILVRAEVNKIIIENNKAKGVRLMDDNCIYADTVISGAGVFNTFKKLVPASISIKHKYLEKLKNVKPSVGYICLYIGLKGSSDDLNLPKNNLWIYPDDLDHDSCVDRFTKDNDEELPHHHKNIQYYHH